MEGTFKGWLPGRSYGYIVPDDSSPDIFVHQKETSNPGSLMRGSRLSFEIEETEKGRAARNVQLNAPSYEALAPNALERRGRVKFWNDRGFGFIEPDDGSNDAFVHATALPPEENGYLSGGDVVHYQAIQGPKGPEVRRLHVVGWEPPDDRLRCFADLGRTGWLERLAELAEDEPWDYKHTPSPEPYPILRSYVRYTFQRLEESESIAYSADRTRAAFNTGLVTPNQEEIYALFERNDRPERQPWRLSGFRKASDWEFMNPFGASPPPLAQYFEDPSVLLYDRRCELYINIDHVMEHILRFPRHLQGNLYVARQLLISAEATTKKRVYRNYKTAIPQFYRDRGGEGIVQLLLPICLEDPSRADLALVVDKNEVGTAYRGSTVLTLDMAYNNARLLARPDSEWLQP